MVISDGLLRIGELSKRSGVSPELLRAWEARYGLLRPERTAGGLRLYSQDDADRVAAMQRHLAAGLAAAQAAAAAIGDVPDAPGSGGSGAALDLVALRDDLVDALADLDEPRAQAVLDRVLATASLDATLVDVVLPCLREFGDRWADGRGSIAEEHFASVVLRGRLLGLARGWGLGVGPVALLACLPHERHDLGLIAFGLALRARGWRIVFLGPDAPIATVAETARTLDPALIVLTAVDGERIAPVAADLRRLAKAHRVALGGAAAREAALRDRRIELLDQDLITDADRVTATAAP